jgi:hypothetical protein
MVTAASDGPNGVPYEAIFSFLMTNLQKDVILMFACL